MHRKCTQRQPRDAAELRRHRRRLLQEDMEDALCNDPGIEREGFKAAAEYAQWHWRHLRAACENGGAETCVLTKSAASDGRLYATFRASLSTAWPTSAAAS